MLLSRVYLSYLHSGFVPRIAYLYLRMFAKTQKVKDVCVTISNSSFIDLISFALAK